MGALPRYRSIYQNKRFTTRGGVVTGVMPGRVAKRCTGLHVILRRFVLNDALQRVYNIATLQQILKNIAWHLRHVHGVYKMQSRNVTPVLRSVEPLYP